MSSHNQATDLNFTKLPNTHSFDILCKAPYIVNCFITYLQTQALMFDSDATIKLVIDIPQGDAFSVLETLDRQSLKLIVLTFNPCEEYAADLWDLRPGILLVNPQVAQDITDAVRHAAAGEQYCIGSTFKTPLNGTERRVLNYIARGCSNKNIAEYLAIQETTVMNTATRIFKLLGFSNRTQAALYYWGSGPFARNNHMFSNSMQQCNDKSGRNPHHS